MKNNDIIWGFEIIEDTTPVSVHEAQVITEEEYQMFNHQCSTLAEGLALILGLVNIDRIKNHCTARQAQSLDKAVEYINSLQVTNVQMRS